MSLTRKNLSYHLLNKDSSIISEIKKIVRSKKRRRFHFGMYDENDVVQEAILDLWIRVPKNYDKNRGDIKSYCLVIANSFISRLGYKQNKYRRNVSVDFGADANLSDANDFQKQVSKIMTVKSKRDEILFKVNIEDLTRDNKDFNVVKTIYDCGGDRKIASERLGYSNAYITKQCNRLKRKGVLEKEKLVNAFPKHCIVYNRK